MKIVSTILYEAAERLQHVGWAQGASVGPNGECITTAIARCAGAHVNEEAVARASLGGLVITTLADFLAPGSDLLPIKLVVRWNDTPGRTLDEVLNTLHKCADELEAS